MRTVAMGLLVILWLHMIVHKSSLSVKRRHEADLRGQPRSGERDALRLQNTVEAHVDYLGQTSPVSRGFLAPTHRHTDDYCPK